MRAAQLVHQPREQLPATARGRHAFPTPQPARAARASDVRTTTAGRYRCETTAAREKSTVLPTANGRPVRKSRHPHPLALCQAPAPRSRTALPRPAYAEPGSRLHAPPCPATAVRVDPLFRSATSATAPCAQTPPAPCTQEGARAKIL